MIITEKLKRYIKENVFPEYAKNDSGHDLDHIEYVIRRSLTFAETVDGIDYDMVYAIAAYHDIGHHIDAHTHEKISAEIMLADSGLRKFFSEEDMRVMAEAVCDHRASSTHEPRSIYGKIVSSADRNTSVEGAIKRAYSYRCTHTPTATLNEMIEDSRLHLAEKFGRQGYATEKMFFEDPDYEKFLDDIAALTADPVEFEKKFLEINEIF